MEVTQSKERKSESSTNSPNQTDRSNGWEAVAKEFIQNSRHSTVGVSTIEAWTRTLPPRASVLDIGCGPGSPREAVLVEAGFAVHAIDASPSLAREFSNRFPNAEVACEAVEESRFFDKTFDAVFAWGLLFLLPPETQRAVIHRISEVLKPGGRLLFTAPTQIDTWNDLSTGRTSFSLGEQAYRSILSDAGLTLVAEYIDEGENHYYDATKQEDDEWERFSTRATGPQSTVG